MIKTHEKRVIQEYTACDRCDAAQVFDRWREWNFIQLWNEGAKSGLGHLCPKCSRAVLSPVAPLETK